MWHLHLVRVEVSNIQWDTDGIPCHLPSDMTVQYAIAPDAPADEIHEALIKRLEEIKGWAVKGYTINSALDLTGQKDITSSL